MTELWNRSVVVQLNNTEYRSRGEGGLRIDASVKTKRGKFPEAEIKLYNLRPEKIDEALKADRRSLRVRLSAGYSDYDNEEPPLLFDGNIIRYGASVSWEGPDSVLTLSCKEGIFTFDKIVKIDPLEDFARGVSRGASALSQFIEQTSGVPAATFISALNNLAPVEAVRGTIIVANATGIPQRFAESQRKQDESQRRYDQLTGAIREQGPRAISAGGRALASATPIAGSVEFGKLALGVVNVDPAALANKVDGALKLSAVGSRVKAHLEASTGTEITVNRGYIEVFERRKPRLLRGPLFSIDLGNLLEVPKPVKDKGAGNKMIEFKAMLTPELFPGDRFEVRTKSGRYDGFYVCLEHDMSVGSGYDGQFYSTVKGRLDL